MAKKMMTGRAVPSDLSPPSNPTHFGSSSDQSKIQSFLNVQSIGDSHTHHSDIDPYAKWEEL